jgi:outer membrane protein assembly factor BamB
LVVGGVVYSGCSDGRLYAFEAETGRERWTLATPITLWTSLALADGMLVAAGINEAALFAFA